MLSVTCPRVEKSINLNLIKITIQTFSFDLSGNYNQIVNMNGNNWKVELDRLLEIFERESTLSLRTINQCFAASGCPFDEDFRKYFLKMSARR